MSAGSRQRINAASHATTPKHISVGQRTHCRQPVAVSPQRDATGRRTKTHGIDAHQSNAMPYPLKQVRLAADAARIVLASASICPQRPRPEHAPRPGEDQPSAARASQGQSEQELISDHNSATRGFHHAANTTKLKLNPQIRMDRCAAETCVRCNITVAERRNVRGDLTFALRERGNSNVRDCCEY
jgi:hypothetical protein